MYPVNRNFTNFKDLQLRQKNHSASPECLKGLSKFLAVDSR